MPKQKSAARVLVADGVGGMAPVEDRRFEAGDWPISFEIPAARADDWVEYLGSECTDRNWPSSSTGQLGADENSRSITVRMGVVEQSPQVAIVWERGRGGPLRVRVKPVEPRALDETRTFIDRINERFESRAKRQFYRRGYLQYLGLPWRGELWLDDSLRLGPATRFADWLIAPQIIVLDVNLEAIGWQGANAAFSWKLDEVALFLTAVMRTNVSSPPAGHAWVLEPGDKPRTEVRQLAYFEPDVPSEMPERGQSAPVPLSQVVRPDWSLQGMNSAEGQQTLPADILDLWARYINLPAERRDQFQRVVRTIQMAHTLWREHQTGSLALRVVACEALKPSDKAYDKLNIYGIVEGLLGAPVAEAIRHLRFSPQRVRDSHLHRATRFGDEDLRSLMLSTFLDPTFRQEYQMIAQVTDAAIIEWLRLGGTFAIPRRRGKSLTKARRLD